MNLIYIGDDFYTESGTMMSSIYKIEKSGSLSRSDWGFVQIALEKGEEIHIRQATDSEMVWAHLILKRFLE